MTKLNFAYGPYRKCQLLVLIAANTPWADREELKIRQSFILHVVDYSISQFLHHFIKFISNCNRMFEIKNNIRGL